MKRVSRAAVIISAFAIGCGGAHVPSSRERAEVVASPSLEPYFAKACERSHPEIGPFREGTVRQGSTVALARDRQTLVAYVADRDRRRLAVVDLGAEKVEANVPLFGAPEQVEVLADGRVIVSIGEGRHIEAFEPTGDPRAPLVRLCARALPAGPFALATSPDDSELVVTSAWQPSLTVFDSTLAPRSATPLARAPRGVFVDDHHRAFVTHLVGRSLSLVDLDSPSRAPKAISLALEAGSSIGPDESLHVVRNGSQAYALASVELRPTPSHVPERRETIVSPATKAPTLRAKGRLARETHRVPSPPSVPAPIFLPKTTRIIVPMVSVDPGDESRPGESYYGPPPIAGVPKEAPVAVVVDPVGEVSLTTHVIATTGAQRGGECVLPRSVATHPRQELLYVTCLGLDELLELDARSADPMRTIRRRFDVPKGPTGVAIAAPEDEAVVFGQFEGALALIPLSGAPVRTIDLTRGDVPVDSISLDAAAMRGRELFYRSDDPRITSDGLACSSCHPDGTEDGLTWFTPEGPRQTPMLAGRLRGTAPYGWTREAANLELYIEDTCQRLGGTGIGKGSLTELAAFVKTLPAPPRNAVALPEAVARGRATFEERGCGSCHVNGTGTDAQSHPFDGKPQVDTPSLADVAMTAPYFHDGRYATLEDLLSDKKSDMGSTAGLYPEERVALLAYLGSL